MRGRLPGTIMSAAVLLALLASASAAQTPVRRQANGIRAPLIGCQVLDARATASGFAGNASCASFSSSSPFPPALAHIPAPPNPRGNPSYLDRRARPKVVGAVIGGVAFGLVGALIGGLSCYDRHCNFPGFRVLAGGALGAFMGAVVGGTIGAGLEALEEPER